MLLTNTSTFIHLGHHPTNIRVHNPPKKVSSLWRYIFYHLPPINLLFEVKPDRSINSFQILTGNLIHNEAYGSVGGPCCVFIQSYACPFLNFFPVSAAAPWQEICVYVYMCMYLLLEKVAGFSSGDLSWVRWKWVEVVKVFHFMQVT